MWIFVQQELTRSDKIHSEMQRYQQDEYLSLKQSQGQAYFQS